MPDSGFIMEMYEAVASIDVGVVTGYIASHLEYANAGMSYVTDNVIAYLAECWGPIGIEPTFCLPHTIIQK